MFQIFNKKTEILNQFNTIFEQEIPVQISLNQGKYIFNTKITDLNEDFFKIRINPHEMVDYGITMDFENIIMFQAISETNRWQFISKNPDIKYNKKDYILTIKIPQSLKLNNLRKSERVVVKGKKINLSFKNFENIEIIDISPDGFSFYYNSSDIYPGLMFSEAVLKIPPTAYLINFSIARIILDEKEKSFFIGCKFKEIEESLSQHIVMLQNTIKRDNQP